MKRKYPKDLRKATLEQLVNLHRNKIIRLKTLELQISELERLIEERKGEEKK
jgi:hypothetical protein